jgi:hypothetical protein
MVAFWAIMMNHCALEKIANLGFLACLAEDGKSHQASDCSDKDSCATIESGQYKSEDSHCSVSEESLLSTALVLACLQDLAASEPLLTSRSFEWAPPELAPGWQFSFRTALPPRAPSLRA